VCRSVNEYVNFKYMKYDYLIVGSGLFGATFAYCAKQMGKKCLMIDKRPHLGGNVYCEKIVIFIRNEELGSS